MCDTNNGATNSAFPRRRIHVVRIVFLPFLVVPVRSSDPVVRGLEDAEAIRAVVRALNALAYA